MLLPQFNSRLTASTVKIASTQQGARAMKKRMLGGLVISLLLTASSLGSVGPVEGLLGSGSASADLK